MSNLFKKLGKLDTARGWTTMKKASTFFEKIQNFISGSEDDDMIYEEVETVQEERQPEPSRRNLTVHSTHIAEAKVCIVVPREFDDVQSCAEKLMNRQLLLMHYDNVSEAEKQRMDDFLNGVCHVLGGKVQYITERHILYTPKNVEIEKELFSYSAPVYQAN